MSRSCDWCGKPITEGQRRISYDGGTYHLPCARDSESGKQSPLAGEAAARRSMGLWAFTTPIRLPDK